MTTLGYIPLIILALCSGLPTNGMAARFLLHLAEPSRVSELTLLNKNDLVIRQLSPLPWLVLETADSHHIKSALLAKFARQKGTYYPDVPGYFASTVIKPNDQYYSEQWYLTAIQAPAMWSVSQGEGVIIALLDSGVNPNHPDLAGQILFEQGYDFGDQDAQADDENGHGTAMAGIMVANCHNQQGICGVAPAAQIIPYKLNQQGSGRFFASDLAAAIISASNSPASIISLSLVLQESAPVVQDALTYAKAQGKIIVAAAGNQGQPTVAYPAYLPWVIGVGAADKQGQRLRSSNYGSGLSLTAPGKDLLTTLLNSGYANWFDGTSAATAVVSGILALIVAQQPEASVAEWLVSLLASCQDVDPPGFDAQSGFGKLQAPLLTDSYNQGPTLQLIPMNGEVLWSGEQLKLDLHFNRVSGTRGDLYLRINRPTDNQEGGRSNLFKVWKNNDEIEPIPYNQTLSSPYWLQSDDLHLPLYGTPAALLGTGEIIASLTEGAYELLALLTGVDNSQLQTRKIIWITSPQ